MSFFIPLDQITKSKEQLIAESLLYQVILPQISNTKDRNKIFNFFKNEEYLESLLKRIKQLHSLVQTLAAILNQVLNLRLKTARKNI